VKILKNEKIKETKIDKFEANEAVKKGIDEKETNTKGIEK